MILSTINDAVFYVVVAVWVWTWGYLIPCVLSASIYNEDENS
jgi:hypothetical protein